MMNESAANTDIIWRKIDNNVSLSIVPSDPDKKVFKAKSIIKTKPPKRSNRLVQNKENTLINAQNNQQKQIKKSKSNIPRPSSKSTTSKGIRKGEYQKYVSESKESESTIPITLATRKNSVSNLVSKKEAISKTQMLYNRARAVLNKDKKVPASKSFHHPPLTDKSS